MALSISLQFAEAAGAPEPQPVACDHVTPVAYDELVLIIDDIGHSLSRGRKALSLPGDITFAVIPFTPHGKRLAALAAESGKELMVHTPMSALGRDTFEQGGLTPQLSRTEFREYLAAALEELPRAQGINNHMGSELTQLREQMGWVMEELRGRNLYFVDSRTTGDSVAAAVAREFDVPTLSRQVFLDHVATEEAIDQQFQYLIHIAKTYGRAVAIGHPYPETIRYLEAALPHLGSLGIRLTTVSEALSSDAHEAATTVAGTREKANPASLASGSMLCDIERIAHSQENERGTPEGPLQDADLL
jgi:polysaccharide deacetylase 2 family uncharacterized protein YibQ